MLVAAIATGVLASSRARHAAHLRDLLAAAALPLSHTSQDWIFLCFAVAFLVKMPLVPFHGWLPDGYKAMPIPAVAVFSAILSKVAAYGFLRIVLPLFPYASAHFQTLMLVIALVSVLWGTAGRLHHPRRAAGRRLLERGPARLHHARDLLAAAPGRAGRAAADGQPRAGHGAAVLHRRRAGRARRRLGEARATWAGSPSARRCWPACS